MLRNMNDLVRRLQEDIDGGLSRRQIADKAGVSEGTIRNILKGKTVKYDVYERLADKYLHLPREEVYRMADVLPSMHKGGHLNRDWLLSQLWAALTQLTDAEQAEVLSHVLRLAEQHDAPKDGEQTNI